MDLFTGLYESVNGLHKRLWTCSVSVKKKTFFDCITNRTIVEVNADEIIYGLFIPPPLVLSFSNISKTSALPSCPLTHTSNLQPSNSSLIFLHLHPHHPRSHLSPFVFISTLMRSHSGSRVASPAHKAPGYSFIVPLYCLFTATAQHKSIISPNGKSTLTWESAPFPSQNARSAGTRVWASADPGAGRNSHFGRWCCGVQGWLWESMVY